MTCGRVVFVLFCFVHADVCYAQHDLKSEIEALFGNGDWERALLILQRVPEQQMDAAHKELLAMALLYTSSRLDAATNYEEAKLRYTELTNAGASVRFLVTRSGDFHKPDVHPNLTKGIPGHLIVSKTSVQFVPQEGFKAAPETWKSPDVFDCKPNEKFGADSGSFHITVAGPKDIHFRPLHLSTAEADLICLVVPESPPSAPEPKGKKDKNKKK
jgi:hypothetical protein